MDLPGRPCESLTWDGNVMAYRSCTEKFWRDASHRRLSKRQYINLLVDDELQHDRAGCSADRQAWSRPQLVDWYLTNFVDSDYEDAGSDQSGID